MNYLQMSSPQKGHRTGVDGLLRESEPDGFTEVRTSPSSIPVLKVAKPLSLDQEFDESLQLLSDATALLKSQRAQMNRDWHAKYRENSIRWSKFVKDNIQDETRHTLPKTNERDRRNQPLPSNLIGRHFGTFTRHKDPEQ